MITVYKKEMTQLFHSIIGYVFLVIFTIVSGCYFCIYNLLNSNGDIRNYFSPMMTTAIFLLPILSMRSYSEERKLKTNQLLLSSPLPAWKVAFGKYLALISVYALGVLTSVLYIIVLAAFGQFNFWMTFGSIVGMLISASAFLSIGMFISSLTDNQIVACIVTYAILLGMWLVGMSTSVVRNPAIRSVLNFISISNRFREFSMGLFDISSVFYYVSVTMFFLFMTTVSSEKNRMI